MRSVLIFLVALATGVLAPAQSPNPEARKREILQAIHDGARYAAGTLLDADGKSRCDYQIVEGKWYDYEPPWHTGQLIYALVEAHRVTGTEAYLDAARKAGDWWTGLEIRDHPRLTGMVRAVHGDDTPYIVFATVSDGTAGLFRLFDVTGVRRYADVPIGAGEWMMRHMWNAEYRVFYDCVDPVSGEVLKENSPFWAGKTTQTVYDVARPNNEGSLFKDMYEVTGDARHRAMFLELCESLLQYQDEHGLWMRFMPNHHADGSVHPRFNLWYAESLLEGYELTGDRRYLEAALKTARTHARFQEKDGTIYYTNYLTGPPNKNSICGSAVSFGGIIWLRLLQAGVGEEFRPHIERSVRWVLKNRYAADHPDPNLAGGFFETRVRMRRDRVWMVNRDIATSFGIRLLCDYLRWVER